MKLYYYFDEKADMLYFFKGKLSAKDTVRETSDDVVFRIDPKTKKVRGFTILNFSAWAKGGKLPLPLPIHAELTPV